VRDGLVMICDVDLREANATRVHTLEVARGFAAEGLEIDLLCRGPDPEVPGVRYARAVGTDQQRIRRLASLNAQTVRLLWQRRAAARRLYVRHNWTILVALLLGRALGYRIVTQVDDVPYGRGYELDISPVADYVRRVAALIMGQLAHGIVAVTPQIKGLLVELFKVPPERVTVLPNGVDVEFFHPLPRADALARLGLDPGLRYILFVGEFAHWVDFDTILDSFALVSGNRPDARLILVGDGYKRAHVQRRIRELGIEDRVTITGAVRDREKVRDYVAAATVALAAHRREHCARIGVSPVKVAEYLASGRAVVAIDVPGLRETLVQTGAGRVVSPDPVAMSAAIVDLLADDRAAQLGVRGRELAEERFAWRMIVRRTLPLFGI
jgi:glycosyltransferase involved in cell wall biosynthesis